MSSSRQPRARRFVREDVANVVVKRKMSVCRRKYQMRSDRVGPFEEMLMLS